MKTTKFLSIALLHVYILIVDFLFVKNIIFSKCLNVKLMALVLFFNFLKDPIKLDIFGMITTYNVIIHLFVIFRSALLIEKCDVLYLLTTNMNDFEKKYNLCTSHFVDGIFSNFQKKRLSECCINFFG